MTKARRDVRPIIIAALDDLERATATQIHAAVWKTGLTLDQVRGCLYNGHTEGWLASSGKVGNRSGKGGVVEAIYSLTGEDPKPRKNGKRAAKPAPTYRQFASVFHYAQNITAKTEAA